MAQLVINRGFLDEYKKARVDDDLRGVMLALPGDVYCLLTVMRHDKAIEYAVRRKFTVNQAIGVMEVRDEQGIDNIRPGLEEVEPRRRSWPGRFRASVSSRSRGSMTTPTLSTVTGPPCTAAGRKCGDRPAELAGLIERVREWLDAGVEPRAIGVAARSTKIANAAKEALTAAGIKASSLASSASVVRTGTMHMMKGLEFQCVAVIGVDADVVPPSAAITPYEDDAKAHAQDLQRERCLLFVACTRARDRLYVSCTRPASAFLGVA